MDDFGFWKIAEADPDRLAVIECDGRTTTFGNLYERSNQIVYGLRDLGLVSGDTVAILIENRIVFIEIQLAISQAGLCLIPINWHLSPLDVAYVLKDSKAKVFISSIKHAETGRKAVAESKFEKAHFFTTEPIEGIRNFEDIIKNQPTTRPDNLCFGFVKGYTSGTTGKPKGVVRKFTMKDPDVLAAHTSMFLLLFGIQPHDDNIHLTTSPLYHLAPNQFASMSLHFGHSIVLMRKWTPEETLSLIEKYKVTTSQMVPTMFHRLIRLPEKIRNNTDVSSLRIIVHSAAPCPTILKKKMLDWWGPIIYEYYAATEGGGTLATPEDALKKPGTVGKTWPITDLKILSQEGVELPTRKIGTIYMRIEGGHRFEYDNDKSKTDNAFRGDFFTAGDMGYLDEDGYLFLTGRQSDMIIVGGVNIYPAEIENELSTFPGIADIAVFGVPNEDLGEEIKALIQLEIEVDISDTLIQDIKRYCEDRLGKFRIPHSIEFVDSLPRSETGKLSKNKLRESYWGHRRKKI